MTDLVRTFITWAMVRDIVLLRKCILHLWTFYPQQLNGGKPLECHFGHVLEITSKTLLHPKKLGKKFNVDAAHQHWCCSSQNEKKLLWASFQEEQSSV